MFRNFVDHFFINRRKEIPFIIFFTFFVTFVIARVVAYSIHHQLVPDFLFFVKTVYIKGYHIHHFNFGIVLLAAAGFLSLVDGARKHVRKIAIFYGIGLALIVDEFGLLVTLDKDAYWGRRSYDAVIATALVLLNVVYFRRFWRIMESSFKRIFSSIRRLF